MEGNFIAFVGNIKSRKLVREVVGLFRRHAQFPSEAAALPERLVGVGWSDQWSFWQASQITNRKVNNLLTYPHFTEFGLWKICGGFPSPYHLQKSFYPRGKLSRHVIVIIDTISIKTEEGIADLI